MTKSKLLTALLFCSAIFTATAYNGKADVLYVDGTSHSITLTQVAKLQVTDGNAIFLGKDGKTVATHKISDIQKINLTAGTTSITQKKDGNGIILRSYDNMVSAEGMADGKVLEIFSAGGELVKKVVSTNGKATADVHSLANGIYVIKADGQSLKMVKR